MTMTDRPTREQVEAIRHQMKDWSWVRLSNAPFRWRVVELADAYLALLDEHERLTTKRGSNGEAVNAPVICPKCGSADGSLGTSNAYFICKSCGGERYWTPNHEHQNDWPVAIAASPFGNRGELLSTIMFLREQVERLTTWAEEAHRELNAFRLVNGFSRWPDPPKEPR